MKKAKNTVLGYKKGSNPKSDNWKIFFSQKYGGFHLSESSSDERNIDVEDSILKFLGKNRLGEVGKEAFSSGVETTFLCEQITNGVTSFGLLLSQRRSQRRPKQKRDPNSTECLHESQK